MRYIKAFLLLSLFALFGALIGAPSANASSIYDDVIQTTDYFGTPSCDFSDTFAGLIDNAPNSGGNGPGQTPISGCNIYYARTGSDPLNSWSAIKDAWSIADSWSLRVNGNTPYLFASGLESEYRFETVSGPAYIFSQYTSCTTVNPCLQFDLTESGAPSGYDVVFNVYSYANDSLGIQSRHSILSHSQNLNLKLYLIDGDYTVVYPPDYEGIDPPIPEPPVDTVDYVPNFYVSVSTDWRATIHDTNFNTIDDVPFTCTDGLVPVIHYELWDKNFTEDILITSGTQSASMQFVYQFDKVDTHESDYRIVGWYDCGGDPVFSDSSYHDFTITKNGILFTVDLSTCITDEIPYINFDSCVNGLNSTIALLSFDLLNLENPSIAAVADNNPNSCHTLTVLGDWLGNENMQVCAQMPEDVRNAVTPFALFIISSTMFLYISRGSQVTFNG